MQRRRAQAIAQTEQGSALGFRFPRQLVACVLLGWLAAACTPAGINAQETSTTDTGDRYAGWTVTALRVEGLPETLPTAIKKNLALNVRSGFLRLRRPEFHPRLLDADRRRLVLFLARSGYPFATTTVRFEPESGTEKLAVIVVVDPGPAVQIGTVSLDGLPRELTDRRAPLLAPLQQGTRFDEAMILLVAADIEEALNESGYAHPQVDLSMTRPAATIADVHFTVVSGDFFRITTVTVEGAPDDLEGLARKTIDVDPGTPYSPRVIREARDSLRKLDLFRQIRLDTDVIGPESLDLSAELAARNYRTAELSVGTWTDNPIRVRGLWMHRNIFKRGRGLSVEGAYARTLRTVKVDTWWQALLRVRSRASLGFKYEVQNEDAYYQEIYEVGLSNLFYTVGAVSWRVGLIFADNKVDPRTDDPTAFPDDAGKQIGLSLRWYRDTTRNPLDPQQGTRLTLIGGWAPPNALTDNPFASVQGIATWYLPLARNTILASRLDLGVATPLGDAIDLLPSQRYFAGGFNTMRGYARRRLGPYDSNNDPIGGEARVLASVSLRFPIKGILGGSFFCDSGQVWRLRDEMTLENYKAALGAGIMFHTPIGPIHLETAYNIIEPLPDNPWWMFHFGIGHPF